MAHSRRLGKVRYFQGVGRPFLFFLGLGSAAACSSSDRVTTDTPFPGFFSGGAPTIVQPTLANAGTGATPTSAAGSGGSAGSALLDPCANVPEGQLALIDDFEDGNQDAVPEPDREAYWFPLKDDESSTGTLVPEKVFLGGVPTGAHGSPKAAHITASGFTVWGAAFAANISHLKDDIRCPFNAAHFSGYRFYARGSGRIWVMLQVPEVIDEQYGGKCRPSDGDVCYDAHGIWITLTPDWKTYSFKWSDFKQRGFGKQTPFTPGAIMSLQFSFEKAELPVDFWLDDVSWDDGSTFPPPGVGGSGGTGGSEFGGSGGLGGSSGLSGAGGLGEASGSGGAAGAANGGAAGQSGSSASAGIAGMSGGIGGSP